MSGKPCLVSGKNIVFPKKETNVAKLEETAIFVNEKIEQREKDWEHYVCCKHRKHQSGLPTVSFSPLSQSSPPFSPGQRIRVLLPNREQYSPSSSPSFPLSPPPPSSQKQLSFLATIFGRLHDTHFLSFIFKKTFSILLWRRLWCYLKYSTLKNSSDHPVLQYTILLLQRHSGIRMPCLHALLPFLLLLPFVEAKSGKLPPTTQHRLLHAPKKIESYAEMYIHPASALLPLHGINMCLYLIPKSGKTSKKCQT